ncbi:MAG TPA: carboxypeptidase regulatory-like domain-containing protein, partial [Thermoanaerobaculia bacterium]|nr:carboxypeptidase regulatory-like domain-containing protein [Thermoanaerobaculia bacterium]
MNRILKVTLCLALVLMSASAVQAQGVQTATLIGTVRGADGSPLPGVTVTATSPVLMGERSTITAETGEYVIRGLTPGAYTVTFSLEGMVTVDTKAELGLGTQQRADAQLTSSVTEETIVVTAEAPAALDTVTVGANFTATKVDELPIVTRTPVAIGALSGGVTGGDRDLRTPVVGQLSINGGMAYDNAILINGVNVMDPIFGTANNLFIEDAVAETQVLTSGISAEYGAFTGGVLNVITKSGGNDFHGSLRANYSKPEWRDETPFEDARNIEREGDLSHNLAGTLGG